jgi:hypothetical protein
VKKSHGPDFITAPVDLIWCSVCRGKAVVTGIFHDLPCGECHASGWVSAETGRALPVEILVTQLGLLLNIYQRRIIAFGNRLNQESGAQQQYEQNNRRGAGASNYTGD